jgi:hypothetical protein
MKEVFYSLVTIFAVVGAIIAVASWHDAIEAEKCFRSGGIRYGVRGAVCVTPGRLEADLEARRAATVDR